MLGKPKKYHWIKSGILILLFWITTTPSYAQLVGYSDRIKVQINASEVDGNTDLTNFPVLVSGTFSELVGVAHTDGYDITFTSANGTTILSHQLETYDSGTGFMEFWVRFPTLSTSTDTEFYIYFGNGSITTDQSSTNVWDSNYKLVLHLNNDFVDATGENADATNDGTDDIAGYIGRGRDYGDGFGETDRIFLTDSGVSPLDITGNITISFWMYGTDFSELPDIISKGNWNDGYGIWPTTSGVIVFQINNDDLRTTETVDEDEWEHITVTRATNGDRVIYINGAESISDNSTASFNTNDDPLYLSTESYNFEGVLDEVRLSNITRDSAWIATEFNNQSAPGTFLTQINAEAILDDIEASALAYNSGDSPTTITSAITITETDDTNLEGATIEITSNYDSSEDVLAFSDQNGITGSWDSVTGILTLTGTSSVANYETALQSITYENTNPAPSELTRTVSFTANDGDDDSNTETRDITVTKVNIAPTVADIESANILYFAGNGETVITNSITTNDLDDTFLDSAFVEITSGYQSSEDVLDFTDNFGITGTWNVSTGILKLEGDTTLAAYQSALRTVTYENTADPVDNTNRTISFSVHDGDEESSTVTRDIEFPDEITDLGSYRSSDVVFHFDAQDADGDGDSGTNQPSDGTLSAWGDRSDDIGTSSADIGNSAPGGDEPTLNSSFLGGRSALLFDYNSGNNGDNFQTNDNAILNQSTFTEKSFAVVFRTTENTSGLQVVYEQGGGSRGWYLGLADGDIYAYAFSNQWTDQNHPINLGPAEPNTTYILIASFDATSGVPATNLWEAALNGGSIITDTDVEDMTSHNGDPTIGEEDGTRSPLDGSNPGNTNNFDGYIAELIAWNDVLSSSDFSNIYAFLSDKWFNVPPVLSGTEVSSLSYSEGDAATAITSTISISDEENDDLDSAKVYISSGFESSEDILAGSGTGITGSYNSTTGVLTLEGTTTIANYLSALQSVTYENTNLVNPSTTTREISFIVYDWDDSSNVATRDIEVIPVNTAPTLTITDEGTTLTFTEGDGPTTITTPVTIADIDNTELVGATIAFTDNYFLGEDELAFTNQNGIIGSFDAISGILTLSGNSSLANYQTALQSVSFENTSTDPVTGLDREVTFRIFDGTDSSSVQTRNIEVIGVNTVPTLANLESSSLFYSAGDTVVVTETITVTDPDDTNIESATFQFTSGYLADEDTLLFEDIFGITGAWTEGTQTLTLTGPASKADFESALQVVNYVNTGSTPTDSPRDVTITINDGTDDSNSEIRSISFSIPKSVSGLTVWLKGDAGVNTSGSNVTSWEDQSGNGHDFSSTGSTDPTIDTPVSTLNNQTAIRFPGNAESKLEDGDAESTYLSGWSELTIFFVIQSDGVGSDKGFWSTEPPSGNDRYFSIRYDNVGDNGSGDDVITTGLRDLDPAFTLESFEEAQTTNGQIVMLKWTSETTYELYVDGILSNPTFSQNIPTGTLVNVSTAIVGQGPLDSGSSWEGLIAEVILYDNEISLSDQETVEDYLSNKYDIPIRFLTPATGGEAISADDASIAPSPAWTTLTGPRVQESFAGEFSLGTFVFEAPTGFEWNTGASPSASVNAAFGGSTNLVIGLSSVTSSQITFTVTTASSTNPAEIIFSDIEVRPTTGTLPNSGNITNSGTTGLGGGTNYGDLTMVAGTQIEMEYAQQPGTSNDGSAITPSPRIQLIDQFGNSVEEGRVEVDMALNQVSGSGALDGSSTTLVETNLFGIAEFDNLVVNNTGTNTITASSTGLADTTSNEFDVVVLGQLTNFVVERVPSGNISDKLAGQSFNITIVAVDGAADTVDTFTGTISLTSNCTIGTGSGTSPSFTAGVLSSLTVSISSTGTCSLTATNSAGAETGTSNTFTVTPGAPSEATTTISASPTVIFNDGFATSTITVQAKDSEGNNVTAGGETVALSVTSGSLGSVTDNSDGTYTATLTSSVVAGTATITGTLNAVAITDDAEVEYAEFNTQWQSQIGSVSDARNWDDAANWSSGTVPISTDKVLIPATPSVGNEQPVISSTGNTIEQISIENSATVTLSGGINFIITGEASGLGEILGSNTDSLTLGGNLDLSDATVGYTILNGSSNQEITSPNSFTNLELDNTSGADFAGDVTVTDSLRLVDGTMFLPSGSNLIANAKYYSSGTIRMQREITGSIGWRLISSPFNTTYGDLLDGTLTQGYSGAFYSTGSNPGDTLQPNVLTYLESYEGTDNQRYRAPGNVTDALVQGQGMFLFVFGDIPADSRYNDALPDTLDASGEEWDGDGTEVDFGITYTPAADSGWNLVGNPFAATIDWDDAANWTKTNVESTIYVWDPAANGGEGEYLTWNGVTGTLGTGLISPFQGFWVKANAASPELIVDKDAKTTAGNFLRKAPLSTDSSNVDINRNEIQEVPVPLIQLAVTSDNGRSKRTNIIFTEEGKDGKDDLDAYRLLPLSTSHIELHTLLPNGTELAINNLAVDFNTRYFIPIHFDAFENNVAYSGTFEMVWGDFRAIPDDWIITLIDNDTGQEIDMFEELSYTFNHSTRAKIRNNVDPLSPNQQIRTKAATMDTRFTIKVSTEEIELDVPEDFYLAQNYPNPFNPETNIEFGLNQNSRVTLEIWDILGRRVRTLINEERQAGRYTEIFNARDLASGVYFYRLQTQAVDGSGISGGGPNNAVFTKKMVFIK